MFASNEVANTELVLLNSKLLIDHKLAPFDNSTHDRYLTSWVSRLLALASHSTRLWLAPARVAAPAVIGASTRGRRGQQVTPSAVSLHSRVEGGLQMQTQVTKLVCPPPYMVHLVMYLRADAVPPGSYLIWNR